MLRRALPCAFLIFACDDQPTPKSPVEPAPPPKVVSKPATSPPPVASPVPPTREASKVEVEKALARLEGWVRPGAGDNENAWAMAHGVAAFGPKLKARDGRLAVDAIVHDYVQVGSDGGRPTYDFPLKSADGTPVQSHDGQIPFLFLTGGVPLDRTFKTQKGGKVSLRALLASVEKRFSIPSDDDGWHNFAWGLMAFQLDDRKKLKSATKEHDMKAVALEAIAQLEQRQSFLMPHYEAKRPDLVQKRKQGIYGHHCGGLHFVQASVQGAAQVGDPAIGRVRKQLDVILFRWDAERRIYRAMQTKHPQFIWPLLIQELKFYGHILEAFGVALRLGVLPKDDATKVKVRQVAADMVDTINRLQPAYETPDAINLSRQNRFDVVGDGAHAILGIRHTVREVY